MEQHMKRAEHFYIVWHYGNHGRLLYKTTNPSRIPLQFTGADRWEELERESAFAFLRNTRYDGETARDMWRRLVDLDEEPLYGSSERPPKDDTRRALITYAREGLIDQNELLAMFISLVETASEQRLDIAMDDAAFEFNDDE